MKWISLLFLALLIALTPAQSQTQKTGKKLAKADKLTSKGKLDKASYILEEVVIEYPRFGKAWDQLSALRHEQYMQAKERPSFGNGSFVLTTTDKDGNVIEGDSLANAFIALLTSFTSGEREHNAYEHTLHLATMYTPTAEESSVRLRTEFVDPKLDTSISEAAQQYFHQAEAAFQQSNFNQAAKLYQMALDEEPLYFKASLYLGDSYFFQGLYLEAIQKFSAARDSFPELLEPRKYLMDAYIKEGLYELALKTGIESMMVYPDPTMLARLKQVARLTRDKEMKQAYTQRTVLPNSIVMPGYTSQQAQPVASGAWIQYQEAQNKIKEYCDDNGIIIEENDKTSANYLEVYSWEYMLSKSDDETLNQARKMSEKGYLDCYVLISNFHVAFYKQFKHFVANNEQHIQEYFEFLLAGE